MTRPHYSRSLFQVPGAAKMPLFRRRLLLLAVACSAALLSTSSAQAQTCAATVDKTVVICSPANGASVTSPVQVTAAAKDTAASVTSMALYVDGVKTATGQGANFSASVTMTAGSHGITVRAWDSAGATFVSARNTITVGSGSPPPPPPGTCSPPSTDRTVAICAPANNSTVASPVQFSAAARDNSHTVTAMAVYVDGTKKVSSTSATLSGSAPLTTGAHSFTVKAWDSLGSFISARYNITVTSGTTSGPTVNISANPASVSAGEASTLTVSATNASTVTVKDNVTGQSYPMASSGGTLSVTPQQTTTYTATATDANGAQKTASTTVTVGGTGDITAVNHIIFMLQENRSFDSYFGMLNPYRRAKGWNVGSDGKTYDVDGIDDKLNTISNQSDEGETFKLFHTTSSCLDDMTSAWLESYGDV